jgi:hypothetical protein
MVSLLEQLDELKNVRTENGERHDNPVIENAIRAEMAAVSEENGWGSDAEKATPPPPQQSPPQPPKKKEWTGSMRPISERKRNRAQKHSTAPPGETREMRIARLKREIAEQRIELRRQREEDDEEDEDIGEDIGFSEDDVEEEDEEEHESDREFVVPDDDPSVGGAVSSANHKVVENEVKIARDDMEFRRFVVSVKRDAEKQLFDAVKRHLKLGDNSMEKLRGDIVIYTKRLMDLIDKDPDGNEKRSSIMDTLRASAAEFNKKAPAPQSVFSPPPARGVAAAGGSGEDALMAGAKIVIPEDQFYDIAAKVCIKQALECLGYTDKQISEFCARDAEYARCFAVTSNIFNCQRDKETGEINKMFHEARSRIVKALTSASSYSSSSSSGEIIHIECSTFGRDIQTVNAEPNRGYLCGLMFEAECAYSLEVHRFVGDDFGGARILSSRPNEVLPLGDARIIEINRCDPRTKTSSKATYVVGSAEAHFIALVHAAKRADLMILSQLFPVLERTPALGTSLAGNAIVPPPTSAVDVFVKGPAETYATYIKPYVKWLSNGKDAETEAAILASPTALMRTAITGPYKAEARKCYDTWAQTFAMFIDTNKRIVRAIAKKPRPADI